MIRIFFGRFDLNHAIRCLGHGLGSEALKSIRAHLENVRDLRIEANKIVDEINVFENNLRMAKERIDQNNLKSAEVHLGAAETAIKDAERKTLRLLSLEKRDE